MATDGPTPPSCDEEIREKGTHVFTTAEIPSNAMERWVRQVAERSGQRVDWFFFAGRAVVKALGDIDKVNVAIQELIPEHDRLYKKAVAKYRHNRGS